MTTRTKKKNKMPRKPKDRQGEMIDRWLMVTLDRLVESHRSDSGCIRIGLGKRANHWVEDKPSWAGGLGGREGAPIQWLPAWSCEYEQVQC